MAAGLFLCCAAVPRPFAGPIPPLDATLLVAPISIPLPQHSRSRRPSPPPPHPSASAMAARGTARPRALSLPAGPLRVLLLLLLAIAIGIGAPLFAHGALPAASGSAAPAPPPSPSLLSALLAPWSRPRPDAAAGPAPDDRNLAQRPTPLAAQQQPQAQSSSAPILAYAASTLVAHGNAATAAGGSAQANVRLDAHFCVRPVQQHRAPAAAAADTTQQWDGRAHATRTQRSACARTSHAALVRPLAPTHPPSHC